jgi:hypothetical protein
MPFTLFLILLPCDFSNLGEAIMAKDIDEQTEVGGTEERGSATGWMSREGREELYSIRFLSRAPDLYGRRGDPDQPEFLYQFE